MPRHDLWWTFFSMRQELERLPPAAQIAIKRTISRVNKMLRRYGLPPVDNGDYVTFRMIDRNWHSPDRSYFTGVLYYHKCLYTLSQTTDFLARCSETVPLIRRNLTITAARKDYPTEGVVNFLHYIVIPGLAYKCFCK